MREKLRLRRLPPLPSLVAGTPKTGRGRARRPIPRETLRELIPRLLWLRLRQRVMVLLTARKFLSRGRGEVERELVPRLVQLRSQRTVRVLLPARKCPSSGEK